MNDQDPATDTTAAKPAKKPTKPAKKPAKPAGDAPTAKIRCLEQVKARGFTFSRGRVMTIALAHAEYLVKEGKAEILDVTAAPAP